MEEVAKKNYDTLKNSLMIIKKLQHTINPIFFKNLFKQNSENYKDYLKKWNDSGENILSFLDKLTQSDKEILNTYLSKTFGNDYIKTFKLSESFCLLLYRKVSNNCKIYNEHGKNKSFKQFIASLGSSLTDEFLNWVENNVTSYEIEQYIGNAFFEPIIQPFESPKIYITNQPLQKPNTNSIPGYRGSYFTNKNNGQVTNQSNSNQSNSGQSNQPTVKRRNLQQLQNILDGKR
jgi:hypothetical protein